MLSPGECPSAGAPLSAREGAGRPDRGTRCRTPGISSAPDLGGQHLIGLYAMRHDVAEGAASVHALAGQLAGPAAPARPLAW